MFIEDPAERKQKAHAAQESLVGTAELLRAHGIPVQTVSAAGTGTYDLTGSYPGITELQPGSYIFMDGRYRPLRPEFRCALTLTCHGDQPPRTGTRGGGRGHEVPYQRVRHAARAQHP